MTLQTTLRLLDLQTEPSPLQRVANVPADGAADLSLNLRAAARGSPTFRLCLKHVYASHRSSDRSDLVGDADLNRAHGLA